MTPYRFRAWSAAALFLLLAFGVLAFGAVDTWAVTILEVGSFLLAAVWVARLALMGAAPVWTPFYWPFGLLVAWTAAQAVFGLSVDAYQTRAELLKWLALALLFAVACQCFTDESIRRRFRLALVWFGFGLCVLALAQHFTSRGTIYWITPLAEGRPFGPFVNSNHFAALLELMLPAALLLALRPSPQRPIYGVVCGLMLSAVIVSGSRMGIVVVSFQTLVVLASGLWDARRSRRRSRDAWWPVAAMLFAIVLVFAVAGSQRVLDRFAEQQPYSVRWSVAATTWRLFLDHPWTGYGAGTFSRVYPSAAAFDLGLFWSHAHNDFAQFAMEWGVAGVLAPAGILFLVARRRWPREVWLNSLLPALCLLAHSWFDFPLQVPAIAAAWLMVLALAAAPPRVIAATHEGKPREAR